jgi:hypothetical protein
LDQLPGLFINENKKQEQMKAGYEKNRNPLCGSRTLTHAIVVVQKSLASETTGAERIEMVEWEHPELPIKMQAN